MKKSYVNIPMEEGLVSFEELELDYPDLTLQVLGELAEKLSVPIIEKRIKFPGSSIKKRVVFLGWEDAIKVEELLIASLARDDVDMEIDEDLSDDFEGGDAVEIETEAGYSDVADTTNSETKFIVSHRLSLELEIPQQTMDAWAIKHGILPVKVRFPGRAPCISYDEEQCVKIREIVEERRKFLAGKDEHSVAKIRNQFKIGRVRFAKILAELEIIPVKRYFSSVLGDAITTSERKILLTYIKTQIPKRAPRNVKSVDRWRIRLGTSPKLLTDLAVGAGVPPKDYVFDGHIASGLTFADIKAIKQAYDPSIMRKILPISITKVSRANKMSGATLLKLANGVGITPSEHRFGGAKTGEGFTPDQINAIQAGYEAFNMVKPIDDKVEDLDAIAVNEDIDRNDLEALLEGTPIRTSKRKLANGEHADVLWSSQLERLRDTYAEFTFAR